MPSGTTHKLVYCYCYCYRWFYPSLTVTKKYLVSLCVISPQSNRLNASALVWFLISLSTWYSTFLFLWALSSSVGLHGIYGCLCTNVHTEWLGQSSIGICVCPQQPSLVWILLRIGGLLSTVALPCTQCICFAVNLSSLFLVLRRSAHISLLPRCIPRYSNSDLWGQQNCPFALSERFHCVGWMWHTWICFDFI